MFDVIQFLAALAFAAYAKNKGRSYVWGGVPFALVAAMQWYAATGGGGLQEPMRSLSAFAVTLLLYFIVGQAKIAADNEEKEAEK